MPALQWGSQLGNRRGPPAARVHPVQANPRQCHHRAVKKSEIRNLRANKVANYMFFVAEITKDN